MMTDPVSDVTPVAGTPDKTLGLRRPLVVGGVVGALVGIGVGIHYATRYYGHATGDWQVGLHAAGVGAEYGVPVALGIAVGLTMLAVVLRELLPSLGSASSSLGSAASSPPRLRRAVLTVTVRLLVLGGALVGVGAGYTSYAVNHDVAVAVIVGLFSALGGWVVAALISLFVEIANSLRTLAAAITPAAGSGN